MLSDFRTIYRPFDRWSSPELVHGLELYSVNFHSYGLHSVRATENRRPMCCWRFTSGEQWIAKHCFQTVWTLNFRVWSWTQSCLQNVLNFKIILFVNVFWGIISAFIGRSVYSSNPTGLRKNRNKLNENQDKRSACATVREDLQAPHLGGWDQVEGRLRQVIQNDWPL